MIANQRPDARASQFAVRANSASLTAAQRSAMVCTRAMFGAHIDPIDEDQVTKYRLTRNGDSLSFAQVLELWRGDLEFGEFFGALLADSVFAAYRFETPALTQIAVSRPFEFVLLSWPSFISRATDAVTYADYFTNDDANQGIVSFGNLTGDATLVVPSPLAEHDAYGHLAAFVRRAPKQQIAAFWRTISETMSSKISDRPIWLSTAGGGVAWLHARLDSRPKYYGYAPYAICGTTLVTGNVVGGRSD